MQFKTKEIKKMSQEESVNKKETPLVQQKN